MSTVPEAERPSFLAGLLKGLGAYQETLAANDGAGFTAAYGKIRTIGDGSPMTAALAPENKDKNRYKNVLAYDHSRVILKDGQAGDYINANWIAGFKNPKRYIATQGPVPDSIVDFWRMVWQERCTVIVKVTREVEKGVLKCHRYWPDPSSEPPQKMVLIGQVEVEHLSTNATDTYVVRKFRLRKGGDELTVQQFSYEVWPDHGVPSTTKEFLDFRDIVKAATDTTKAPVVIHCSAGVGRTGTYLTVDRVLDAVEAGEKSKDLDIDLSVASARKSRVFMVQTEIQYQFCFKAISAGIRTKLIQLGGAEVATEADKAFVQEDIEKAAAVEKVEAEEIADLTGAGAGGDTAVNANNNEIQDAEEAFSKDAELYAIDAQLTSIESRAESIMQAGKELDMSKARPEQIMALVRAGKELSLRKKADRRRQKSKETERAKRVDQARAEAKVVMKKQDEKTAAQKKANKFLAKMGARK